MVDALLDGLLDGRPEAEVDELVAQGSQDLDLNTAVRYTSPPEEVMSLLRNSGLLAASPQPTKLSQRAVNHSAGVMNDLLQKAQVRLDEKLLECKAAKEANLQEQHHLVAELSRLGQQVANKARVKVTTLGALGQLDRSVEHAKTTLQREAAAYSAKRQVNSEQLRQRQQDLLSTEHMMSLTRCHGVESLLQRSPGLDACLIGDRLDIRFHDERLQNSTESLSAEGRVILEYALSRAGPLLRSMGLGRGLADGLDDGDEDVALAVVNRSLAVPTMKPRSVDSTARVSPDAETEQASKCRQISADCAVLGDTYAAVWGDMKDVVDESKAALYEEEQQWKTTSLGLHAQLEHLTAQSHEMQATLAEVTSASDALQEEQTQKQLESQRLDELTQKTNEECRLTIHRIMYEQMCGAVRVRNALLLANLKDLRAEDITDCRVGSWVPSECTVRCDDSLVGGNRTLHREIITKNSHWGTPCPALEHTMSCNQVKCPVNCKLSEWTAFSRCSKECGGGLRTRTRTMLVKPRHGGNPCDTTQESQPCHTGSCDHDCVLDSWTPFSPCSKACGVGYMDRRRPVLEPEKGSGICFPEYAARRYSKEKCNKQKCVGDEECLARADLVLAIDGSGSMTEEGFKVLKTFALMLVLKMRSEAYGQEAMRVGVVQFGNGKLDSSGVVSDAFVVSLPSADMVAVAERIYAMKWQCGFTNMAQALVKAQDLLRSHSRNHAEGVVMLLTDGRPTFRTQTQQAVKAVRAVARLVIVHVQAFRREASMQTLQGYASVPWQTNYVHIPGKKALKGSYGTFITQVLTQLCPRAESPSARAAADGLRGYRLVRKHSRCGQDGIAAPQESLDDCFLFASARPETWKSFVFGAGKCQVYTKNCTSFMTSTAENVYEPAPPHKSEALASPVGLLRHFVASR